MGRRSHVGSRGHVLAPAAHTNGCTPATSTDRVHRLPSYCLACPNTCSGACMCYTAAGATQLDGVRHGAVGERPGRGWLLAPRTAHTRLHEHACGTQRGAASTFMHSEGKRAVRTAGAEAQASGRGDACVHAARARTCHPPPRPHTRRAPRRCRSQPSSRTPGQHLTSAGARGFAGTGVAAHNSRAR